MNHHLAAIESGTVTKTNVIGLRKAIKADDRRSRGYGTSATSPKLAGDELESILERLAALEPRVTGELVDSGRKLLQDRRYRKRLERVGDIVANLDGFRLVRFDWIGRDSVAPIYRAESSDGESFLFYSIPWQTAHYEGLEGGPHIVEESADG